MLVFPKAKDRPVLLSALVAEADLLLTLDEADFQNVIGAQVYDLQVRSPGQFLIDQCETGLLALLCPSALGFQVSLSRSGTGCS